MNTLSHDPDPVDWYAVNESAARELEQDAANCASPTSAQMLRDAAAKRRALAEEYRQRQAARQQARRQQAAKWN